MKDAKCKETEYDELDAAIAAALGDASAWPAPRAGFEERCVARVEGILEEGEKRRPFWTFGRAAFLKIAASLAVLLGTSAIVFNAIEDFSPPERCAAVETCATSGCGSSCERMVKFLEREESRKAAMEFLADVVCMAGEI